MDLSQIWNFFLIFPNVNDLGTQIRSHVDQKLLEERGIRAHCVAMGLKQPLKLPS